MPRAAGPSGPSFFLSFSLKLVLSLSRSSRGIKPMGATAPGGKGPAGRGRLAGREPPAPSARHSWLRKHAQLLGSAERRPRSAAMREDGAAGRRSLPELRAALSSAHASWCASRVLHCKRAGLLEYSLKRTTLPLQRSCHESHGKRPEPGAWGARKRGAVRRRPPYSSTD